VGSTGSRQRAKVDGLLGIPTSLPPLPVQRRIVDLVAHLDNHLANLQTEREAAERVLSAARMQMFGNGADPLEPLSDLLEVVIDNRGKTPRKLGVDFTDSGAPVISAVNIKNGCIEASLEPRFVDGHTYTRWMKTPTKVGDVLLTSEGPLGSVSEIPDDRPWVLGQRLFGLRGKEGVLANKYLRHFLASAVGQRQLFERSSGSTVVGIRQSELMRLLVPVPTWEKQCVIAETLDSAEQLERALHQELLRVGTFRTSILSVVLSEGKTLPSSYDEFLSEVA